MTTRTLKILLAGVLSIIGILGVMGCGEALDTPTVNDTEEVVGDIEEVEPLVISESDEEITREEFNDFIVEHDLNGLFEMRKLSSGKWALFDLETDLPLLDESIEPTPENGPIPPDDSSDYHDYLSVSRSSSSCSASLSGSDDSWWDWYYGGWWEDGDSSGYAIGRWSGCGSSGGYIKTTMSWSGVSLNFWAGAPGGWSVTADSSTRKTVEMQTSISSSRYASISWCISAVQGFLYSRSLSMTLYVPYGSGGGLFLNRSTTSYMVYDAVSGPSC